MTFVSINREAITRTELLTVCAVSNRKSLSKIDLSETGNGCAPFLTGKGCQALAKAPMRDDVAD
ncbi:hypothetical protein WSS15_29440 [Acetobacter pasteurianus]|nr:hypothetical protein WSS15_29440 [Acetobacter pasteurianus]